MQSTWAPRNRAWGFQLPNQTELSFWQQLFAFFHKSHRYDEPESHRDYKNIRLALYSLRTFTGLTIEQIATDIGMSPAALNMLESRGGVLSMFHCGQCQKIALDFCYPKLAEFYEMEGLKNSRIKRSRRLTADSDEPDHWSS